MQNIKIKQLLSIVITLALVLTILPLTTLSAYAAEIETIEILNLTPPLGGQAPDNGFSVPSEVAYEINSSLSNWTDEYRDIFDSEFIAGNTYLLILQLQMKAGYSFDIENPPFPESKDSLSSLLVNGDVLNRDDYEYERYGDGEICKLRIKFEADPVKYPVIVHKTDDSNNNLSGASLIMELQDPTRQLTYEEISNEDGIATFNIIEGQYRLSELSAPDGYEQSDDEYFISVSANGVYLVIYPGESDEGEYIPYDPVTDPIRFINTEIKAPEKTSILIYKKDNNNRPLEGATIRIEPLTPSAIAGIKEAYIDKTSDENGELEFYVEDLADKFGRGSGGVYDEYKVWEVSAPSGYNKTDDVFYILITGSRVHKGPYIEGENPMFYEPLTFINTKITSSASSKSPSTEKPAPPLIKEDHFAYMKGYPGNVFMPENNITRAEAVVMFSRLLAKSMDLEKDYRDNYYPDVNENAWYANHVAYMNQLGLLKDYSHDENFRPEESVTRAEFAVLAAQFDKLSLTNTNSFTDVAEDHWAVKYINSAANKGWISGYPDKTFKPESHISRAEVVTLVNRILERSVDKDSLTINKEELPYSYKDVSEDHWAFLDIMEASRDN